MTRGWGVIRPRQGGFEVDIRLGPERIRLSFPKRKLADEALRELQRRKALGRVGLPGYGPDPTYDELVPKLLESYDAAGHTARTIRSYHSEMKRVALYWQGRQVSETRRGDVERWINAMRAEGLAASTIRHRLDRLSQIHTWALDHELIPALPCRIPRPSLRESKPGPAVSEAALGAMLRVARGAARAALLLAADAGLRRAEILALEAGDVDLWAGTIRVHGKGGKIRTVPILTPRLRGALRGLPETEGPLLRARSREQLERICRPAWAAGSHGEPRFHELRRRFATVALGAGAIADEVRVAMGHTNLAVTGRYDRERPATWARAVRDALGGKSPDGHRPPAVRRGRRK